MNSPWQTPEVTRVPAFQPILYKPVRLLVKPMITPIFLKLDLGHMTQQDSQLCAHTLVMAPNLYYNLHGARNLRIPLQFTAVGALVAGAAIGAAIAGAMVVDIRVQITTLKTLSEQQTRALASVSKGLYSASALIQKLHLEQEILRKE